MTDTDAFIPITFAPAGPAALDALAAAVGRGKASDPFARVVVVADQQDVAASVRHRLGARGRGVINVTVQTGNRLAAELADFKGAELKGSEAGHYAGGIQVDRKGNDAGHPAGGIQAEHRGDSTVGEAGNAGGDGNGGLKRLSRLLETQAVRLVAEDIVSERRLAPAGQRRFYRSLADAFRRMAERPGVASDDAGESDADAPVSTMNALAEKLYAAYREKVAGKGYYIPAELPHLAAQAVSGQDGGRLPYVIYYLPRRLSSGDVALARALLERGRCEIIGGRTGDGAADAPVSDLMRRLATGDAPAADAGSSDPLTQKADAGALRIISAPDPEEEARAVIRRIAAGDMPLHRIAVIYRQANPYASRLRQELDFAGIPYAGAERRSLADTPTGRLLLGLVDLAAAANRPGGGVIDRERLIEWMTGTSVRWPDHEASRGQGAGEGITIPATRWVNLALEARANGAPEVWRTRLNAYRNKVNDRIRERDGDDVGGSATVTANTAELTAFVRDLYGQLRKLGGDGLQWTAASEQLMVIFKAYRWYGPGESDDDRRNIEEAVSGLAALQEWGAEYSLDALQDAVRSALQSPTDARGQPVGAGVYVGPPAGIVGLEYDAVYALGMVERQFPPRPRADPWLADDAAERQREAALERYDFLGAVAAGREVTLCWPAATADRNEAYPSRWLVEAANLLHRKAGGTGRLAYDKIATGAGSKDWLTTIASREAGLRELAGASGVAPADVADYRMMHLAADKSRLDELADTRMRRALDARAARYGPNRRTDAARAERYNGNLLTEWDGRVGAVSERIAGIGRRERPVSPSALETWAGCPYRYFLGRVLGLSAPPADDDDVTISALERGLLVHKILERFVTEGKATGEELAALAESEFKAAEEGGGTGHYLLWEVEKAKIRASLTAFRDYDEVWLKESLGGALPDESKAEISFGPPSQRTGNPTDLGEVGISVDGLGEVWFQGKIDRLDARGDSRALVRDFKTGGSSRYTSGATAQNAVTVANGQALQLPVYAAAARRGYPNATINASYSFPTADKPTNDGRPYDDEQGLDEFHATLQRIVGMARAGLFPATPDGEGQYSNCHYCDFKRLCPTRRRQIWERKGQRDDAVKPYNALGGKAAINH